ncbi:MAG: hypothetical protein LBH16_11735 [Treponema sp.]|nr:hypothetical protein [Treponema sp.]
MKSKLFLIVLAVLVCVFAAACTAFTADGLMLVAVQNPSSFEILGDFDIKVSSSKFIGAAGGVNFANITSDVTSNLLRDAIEREITRKGGTAAINVSIKYGPSFGQLFLNGLTMGIWAPSTISISGTIVK